MNTNSKINFSYALILLAGLTGCSKTNRDRLTLKKPVVERSAKAQPQKEAPTTIVQNERELLGKPVKDLTDLTQLRLRLAIDRERGYIEDAIKVIERLIALCNDQDDEAEVQQLRLEIADLYFELGKLKDAAKFYREYVKLYPGSKERDYAEYKKILCNFYAQLQPPRDQTRTNKTLKLTASYLKQEPDEQEFRSDIAKIQTACYEDLFEHEKGIFQFYCKQHNFKAAETRLKNIKNQFESVHLFDAVYLELELYLAQLQKNTELIAKKTAEIQAKFPTYTLTLAASKPLNKHVQRF
ncbi:MAG: Outer membrane protein assembly factor BamD [Candidatus Dependentiae bacterium ADurb.Bin331]|nr:MAG: Outer membrane protein assembly factor BamD [Candidatus Dependentiae bacterium ADurb.Bin331]